VEWLAGKNESKHNICYRKRSTRSPTTERGLIATREGGSTKASAHLLRFLEVTRMGGVIPARHGVLFQRHGGVETTYQTRCPWMCMLKVEPRYDPVRSHRRFIYLLARMHLD